MIEFIIKFKYWNTELQANREKIKILNNINFWFVVLKIKVPGIFILRKIYWILSLFRRNLDRKTICILHIGTAKAGSTSIQRYMKSNRKALARQGILYPDFNRPFGQKGNHKSLAYYAAGNDWVVDKKFNTHSKSKKLGWNKADWNKAFEKYLGSALHQGENTIKTVVFSSEQLHIRLTEARHVQKLKSLLSRFFDEIKIVVYLKPQSTLAVSNFSQQLKSDRQIIDFFEGRIYSDTFYDYLNMLDIWSQVIGQDNVLIRLMDNSDESIKDVVKDLVTIINADASQLKDLESNRNISYDSISIDLLILLNIYFSRGKKYELKRSIVKYLRKASSSGKKKLPGKKEVKAFDERYFEKNRKIARKYLNREQLFVVNYDKYPEKATSFSLKTDLNNKLDGLNDYLTGNSGLKDSSLNNWKEIYIKVQNKIQKLKV